VKHAEATRRRRPESACKKIKIILPMICFHICAIYPHRPLSRRARVFLPITDNSFVEDGVPDVPYWLAKNQDNFTDDG